MQHPSLIRARITLSGESVPWRLSVLAALSAFVLLPACFRPKIPSGVIACDTTSDCPGDMTCETVPGNPAVPRLCCGPSGCGVKADAGGNRDSARSDPRPTPSETPDMMAPSGTSDAGNTSDLVPVAETATPADASDASDVPAVANLVTCVRPLEGTPAPTGGKSYCSLELLDRAVQVSLDLVAGDTPLGIENYQRCRAPFDFTVKAGSSNALGGADLSELGDLVSYLRGLCTRLGATEFVGAYAAGWARRVTNVAEITANLRTRAGVDLEVLTPAQELEQRYLAATRNRLGWLVVHALGTELRVLERAPGGATQELVINNDLGVAGKMYFSQRVYFSHLEARSAYKGVLRMELGAKLANWATRMGQGDLAKNLIVDTEDPTIGLAVAGSLRAGNMWDDVAAYERKRDAAATMVMKSAYGFTRAVFPATRVTDLMMSIAGNQFDDLRNPPRAPAYGLYVLGMTSFLDLFAREMPIADVALVETQPSYGYVFRKKFTPN